MDTSTTSEKTTQARTVSAMQGRPMGAAFLAMYASPDGVEGGVSKGMAQAIAECRAEIEALDDETRTLVADLSIHTRQTVRALFEAMARREQVVARDDRAGKWRAENPEEARMMVAAAIMSFAAAAITMLHGRRADASGGDALANLMSLVRDFREGDGMTPRADEDRVLHKLFAEAGAVVAVSEAAKSTAKAA